MPINFLLLPSIEFVWHCMASRHEHASMAMVMAWWQYYGYGLWILLFIFSVVSGIDGI